MSYAIVRVRSYGRYDVKGFRFRSTKFESTRPLAATTNTGVVCRSVDDRGREINYYGVIKDILQFDFAGSRNLKVVFLKCDWFDPKHGTRENKFGMVEVKHEQITNVCNKFVLAYQVEQVYYMSYPCKKFKAWWVVYKANPRERLHNKSSIIPLVNDVEEEVEDILQEDEVPTNFRVDAQILPESLVGDCDDVVMPSKRKRVSKRRYDPDFEYN